MATSEKSNDAQMTLGEHLDELRKRILFALGGLLVAAVAGFVFGREIIDWLKVPYAHVMTKLGHEPDLRVLSAQGGFLLYMKVAMLTGALIASPWIFYQFWMFVSAGLYRREKRMVLGAVPFSAGLFVTGAMFFLLVVAKELMLFFLGFNEYLGVSSELTLDNYINLISGMMLIFGLGFQLPVVVVLLAKMGLVSAADLSKHRPIVILSLFILAAFMTSPSPVDQVLLAIPMWLLYEFGVLLVRMGERKAEKEATG